MNDFNRPDGIERRHIHDVAGSRLHALPVGAAGLCLLLVAALIGVFGAEMELTGTGDGVALMVDGPSRIRSGEYFEMLVTIETKRKIYDAVLRVDEDVWRDVTVNAVIPQSSGEGFRDGSFELHFGTLEAGARLVVKVDGQIHPGYPLSHNEGTIDLADGRSLLATVDYSMKVFP